MLHKHKIVLSGPLTQVPPFKHGLSMHGSLFNNNKKF